MTSRKNLWIAYCKSKVAHDMCKKRFKIKTPVQRVCSFLHRIEDGTDKYSDVISLQSAECEMFRP